MNIKQIKKKLNTPADKETIIKAYENELSIFCNRMDKRDLFYQELENYKEATGKIPNDFLPDWTAYITDGRYLIKNKTWKSLKGVYKRIKQTAVINTVNRLNKGKK